MASTLRQAMEVMLRNSTRLLVEAVGDEREQHKGVTAQKQYRCECEIGIPKYHSLKLNIFCAPHHVKKFYFLTFDSALVIYSKASFL